MAEVYGNRTRRGCLTPAAGFEVQEAHQGPIHFLCYCAQSNRGSQPGFLISQFIDKGYCQIYNVGKSTGI
jgi:hypothetical protein